MKQPQHDVSPLKQMVMPCLVVVVVVAGIIWASQLLPVADTFGAGLPSGMVGPVIAIVGGLTVVVALIVGVMWYGLRAWRWGRPAAIAFGAVGIAFILLTAYNNCLIPQTYCSAIP